MKKIALITALLVSLTTLAQERIMVIADPHVLPQSIIDATPDFDNYMQHQRKMLDLSEPIWYALMDTALKYRPDLLLIPGDLTRDGEPEAHALVNASLKQLNEAGIKTLTIPGNHDSQRDYWTDGQFIAEPLKGVTVIGMDAGKNGVLSQQTLEWVIAQADSAVAKGNMIIAMCHYQILEHFDKQGTMESSCRVKDADRIRDLFMHHGIHLVLTGHFHVNGITTYRDTLSANLDSIVEITTGSPITYPCPYRWLTISKDRQHVSVETENLKAIEGIDDLETYSREWMRVHAANMLPQLALRAWDKADQAFDILAAYLGSNIAELLKSCMPTDDSTKIALTEKYFGSTVIELYLLHSDANEPEYPEADSLAQEIYKAMEAMMHELTDEKLGTPVMSAIQTILIETAKDFAREPLQSLIEDRTQWKSAHYSDRTDDLHPTLRINLPRTDGVETTPAQPADGAFYDLLGRPISQPAPNGIYIHNGQKVVR